MGVVGLSEVNFHLFCLGKITSQSLMVFLMSRCSLLETSRGNGTSLLILLLLCLTDLHLLLLYEHFGMENLM